MQKSIIFENSWIFHYLHRFLIINPIPDMCIKYQTFTRCFLFISIASLGLVYPVAFKCRMGAKKGATKMGRQTESYLDTRAIYSEAEYLKAVLFWLQGQSGPLGGVPKAESNPREGMLDGIAFLPARTSYE